MIIEFILVILIIAIIGKIFLENNNSNSQNTENFISPSWGIGTPFVQGLSQYQKSSYEPPSTQVLKPDTMPYNNKTAVTKNKINKINKLSKLYDTMDYEDYYSNLVGDFKKNPKVIKLIEKQIKNQEKKKKQQKLKKQKYHNKKEINTLPCKQVNKFFVETQFSNSYRDILTVFNYICPDQKILFNLQALPVTATRYTKQEMTFEFIKLISQFVNRVNQEIQKLPESYEVVNNYNNYMPLTSQLQKYTKDKGINIFYKSIGVDYNLYPDIPENAPIEFIDVISMTKEFTESETKYIISFVIKKVLDSISDQLKITVHFIAKNDPVDSCDMFEMCTPTQNINTYQKIAIEFIFVDGIYTEDFNVDYDCIDSCQTDNKKVSNIDTDYQYYSYADLGKDQMLNRSEIIKQFNKKLREHEVEMNNFDINVPYPVYEYGDLKSTHPRNNF